MERNRHRLRLATHRPVRIAVDPIPAHAATMTAVSLGSVSGCYIGGVITVVGSGKAGLVPDFFDGNVFGHRRLSELAAAIEVAETSPWWRCWFSPEESDARRAQVQQLRNTARFLAARAALIARLLARMSRLASRAAQANAFHHRRSLLTADRDDEGSSTPFTHRYRSILFGAAAA